MYVSYYGFTAKPFQLSPNPRFFYASPPHRKALSYLEYGLTQGEGFIVITGPIGTGKSTIASSLLSRLDASHYVAANIVTSNLSPKELLEAIANAFGLQCENTSKSYILREIEHFLISISKANKRAIILIDEAQNLPRDSLEELRMLSNYQISNKPLVQSFLLGQEELRLKVQHPALEQFKQRIIASCHLKALNERETIEYILHRLKQVGWKDKPAFSEQALRKVHEYTQGIPRKINIFMDRSLLFGFMEKVELIDSKVIQSVANELKEELTPDAQQNQETATFEQTGSNAQKSYQSLTETLSAKDSEGMALAINEMLEKSLDQKIQLSQFIDFLLERKKELKDKQA
ncbi:MAG: AAA family ATPase [Hahellaceae bacterium]|nr:AAA family ATPase [Hahellaceae bacterium]